MRVIPVGRHWEQLSERDRGKAMDVYADVELSGHRFQTPVAVTVEIDAAAMLAVPAAEWV